MSKKQKPLEEFYRRRKLKYIGAGVFGLIFAALGVLLLSISHATNNIAPAGTYVWTYPPVSNLTQSGYDLTVNKADNLGNTPYFWSHEVYFINSPGANQGTAYIGLQGLNTAVFSVFGASLSSSPACKVQTSNFDNGAYSFGGTSCISSYPVAAGVTYRLSITEGSPSLIGGTLYVDWQGTVINTNNNQKTVLGDIDVPFSWELLTNQVVNWTEYFGPALSSCAVLPYSNVTFSNFTFDSGQYTQPSSFSENITQNACTSTSSITENSINSFTEQMGIAAAASPTQPPANRTTKIISKPTSAQPTQQSKPSPTSASTPTPTNGSSTSSTSQTGSSLPPTQSESTSTTSSKVKLRKAANFTTIGGAILVVLCVIGLLIEQKLYHKHKMARVARPKSPIEDKAPPSIRHKYPW